MPQIRTSDNTDALGRLTIQSGTSLVFPPSLMTAHVSAVPNHQTGRVTPFETRGAVAMSGVFGYELDLTRLTMSEKKAVKAQIASYNQMRELVINGKFYRLKNPQNSNQVAWNFVSKGQDKVFVATFNILSHAQPYLTKTKLAGLDPTKAYKNVETGEVYGGDELMNLGFYNPLVKQDFAAQTYIFKAIE